jgi:heptosyltransferase I
MAARVLFIRMGAMGDLLHASASLDLIPADINIHWLTSPMYKPLVEQFDRVNTVWTWDKKAGWSAYVELIRQLKKERFDAVINWHPSVKTWWLATQTGRHIYTYKKQKLKQTGETVRTVPRRHAVDDFAVPVYEWLNSHELEPQTLKTLIPKLLPPDPPVVFNTQFFNLGIIPGVGAKRGNRGLPLAEWLKLLPVIKAQHPNLHLHIFGGPDETALAHHLMQQLNWRESAVSNHVARWSILQTASLLAQCQLVIGGDTGPTHLAAAVGARVISPFGPTDARRTGPLGNTQCLTPDPTLPCWPCEKPVCHLSGEQQLLCLQNIVIKAYS